MPEGNVDTGEKKITTPTGEALPGGYESIEKMFADNQKYKQEAIDNKTKKTVNTTLQSELDILKQEKADRIAAEQTDLEKAQVKITELETKAIADLAAVSKANKNTLYERVLSGRLAGLDDDGRKLMRMHYDAAATVSDFTDEDTLKSILDPVDELLEGMKTTDGATVIMTGSGKSVDGKQTSPGGFFAKFRDMSSQDRIKLAQERKKG
jgi:hypothetical protein